MMYLIIFMFITMTAINSHNDHDRGRFIMTIGLVREILNHDYEHERNAGAGGP